MEEQGKSRMDMVFAAWALLVTILLARHIMGMPDQLWAKYYVYPLILVTAFGAFLVALARSRGEKIE